MAIYKVKLKGRQEIASGTMAFHFEKPEGFSYKAGQFGDFTLANPPETDAEGNTRGFSLASAPYEDDLMVATRMRDTAFKRVFKTLELGTGSRAGRALRLVHAPQRREHPRRLPLGRHRRHSRPEHCPPGRPRQAPPQDRPLRLEPTARGRGVPGRTGGGPEGESEFHPRWHDDGDGEIEPALEAGRRGSSPKPC